jgi:hypothetical protein
MDRGDDRRRPDIHRQLADALCQMRGVGERASTRIDVMRGASRAVGMR